MSDDMDTLVGKTIEQAAWDGRNIYLTTMGGVLILTPEVDCCASCYVQHVSGADALTGATVASVETIESVPTDEERAAADVLDAWGHRITTNRGVCTIEMRTDHNGYYGGWMNVATHDMPPGPNARPLDDF